jgi:hypothetical protein
MFLMVLSGFLNCFLRGFRNRNASSKFAPELICNVFITTLGWYLNIGMRVDDLIQSDDSREELQILAERCSQFFEESNGCPLMKNLPGEYGDFHRVKVRKRKHRKSDPSETFSEAFNEAFEHEWKDLRERAIFANGELSFEPADGQTLEPFYIFPIDGYRYMYSREVENSSQDYKTVFDALFEQFGPDRGNEVITDLLKFTYISEKLNEGIQSGAEIIIYNIPYFYAIRVATVDNYTNIIEEIKEIQDVD